MENEWAAINSHSSQCGFQVCALRSQLRDHLLPSMRCELLTSTHPPTPQPHLYTSPSVKAPTEVTLITGLGKSPSATTHTKTQTPEGDSLWEESFLLR